MERTEPSLILTKDTLMSDDNDFCECCGRERERLGELITNQDDWSATFVSWITCKTCYASCKCNGNPWTSGLKSVVKQVIPKDLRQQQYERSLN